MINSRKLNQIHSGIHNLDFFLCGGYPDGITMIEEDQFASFSNLLLNCTISNHLHESKKLIVSFPIKTDVISFLKDLPQRTKSKPLDQTEQSMKIAWRYNNLPDLDEMSANQTKNDFQFELRTKIDDELIKLKNMNDNITIYTHDELLDQLSSIANNDTTGDKKLIIIRNWATVRSKFNENQFCSFLFKLKSLSRLNNLCFILSINSTYLSLLTRQLSINIVDCSFQIECLDEKSVYKNDYLGLININKLPKINCLNYQTTTETLEIGIQLKKNRFLNVDKLFLPPELSDAPSRTTSCSANKVDF